KLGEALDERLHFNFARPARRCAHHGAKGIHHHDARIDRRDPLGNFIENCIQILSQYHVAEVDKADGVAKLGFVEERILLLVAQHFYGGFAKDGEKERGVFRRGIGENNLMNQGGFAAPRRAGDDVERKLRDTAAQDVVEAVHAGRYFSDRDFRRLADGLFWQFAFIRIILGFHFYLDLPKSKSLRDSFGHTSHTIRSIKVSPMKATSRSSNWATRTTLPLARSSGSACTSALSNPAKEPSALTCIARSDGRSASARASARARSARKPVLPMRIARCGRNFSQTGKAAGVFVAEDLFPLVSQAMRRSAKSSICGVLWLI